MSDCWATDGMISFPVPPPQSTPVLASFDGFGFTMSGICHDLTTADLEDLITPMFAPEGWRGEAQDVVDRGRPPTTAEMRGA